MPTIELVHCDGCGEYVAEVFECTEPGCANDTCINCEDLPGRCLVCQKAAAEDLAGGEADEVGS